MNSSLCANVSTASLEYDECLAEADMEALACPDPSLCNTTQSGDNVGLAFGLTIGAGLATTIGALLPFVPCIKRANTRFLAIGLGLAAGVMLYVSFTEIWTKSKDNFCCVTPDHFDLAVTACFFGGILLTILLDLMVAGLQKIECSCCLPSQWRLGSRVHSPRCWCCTKYGRGGKMSLHGEGVSATNSALHLEKITRNGVHNPNGLIAASSGGDVSGSSSPDSSAKFSSTLEDSSLANGAPSVDKNAVSNTDQGDTISHNPSITNSNGAPPLNSEQQSQLTSETDSSRYFVPVITPDGASVSVNSIGLSESTNNYATVSVNELFSNSSLLRMNAAIPETESLSLAEWGEGGEEKRVGEGDSLSHVSVQVEGLEVTSQSDGLRQRNISYQEMSEESSSVEPLGPKEFKEITEGLGKDTKKLHRMGILTGLAIGIHNFPEGLATFVATLSYPRLGAALAVAIAIHNVPEGMCVALPVYYATGSKWKGFLWAFLSGISEPLGALLGWLVLQEVFGPLVYGIAFGLISGMMVFIALKELLPTAYKFDSTHGKVVSACLVIGMLVMAVSLILFLY